MCGFSLFVTKGYAAQNDAGYIYNLLYSTGWAMLGRVLLKHKIESGASFISAVVRGQKQGGDG
jgi:hypothetical protein